MSTPIVGIDAGTNLTRVVVCEPAPSKNYAPAILGTGQSESFGIRQGYVANLHEASKSIRLAVRDAEKATGMRIKRARVAIGGISLLSETVTSSTIVSKADGEITDRDIAILMGEAEQKVLKDLKNRRIIHTSPIQYKIDGNDVLGSPLGMQGIKLEVKVLFVTCLTHHYNDLMTAVNDAGIEVLDIVPAPLAQSEAVLSQRQKIVGCLLVDIGAETVSLAVFENEQLISLEVLAIGSTDITNDIALGFQIPLDQAEKIKRGMIDPSFPNKDLDSIIKARLKDIFELIEQHLKKIKRNGLLPAGVVITGGGSTLNTIEDFAKTSLKLPTTVVNVRHVQSLNKHKIYDSSWFVSYGLCFLTRGRYKTRTMRNSSSRSSAPTRSWGKGLKQLLRHFLP